MKLSAGTLLSPAAGEWLEVPCLPAPGPVVDTVMTNQTQPIESQKGTEVIQEGIDCR